ncbi:MAG: LON peptidase substrate-binding domain-containing protein [Alphaproteobacteria bacterium]|nr:LON peptidase substrate-binding domain-containing protein [Alphaproteobacteria bacterium]
MKKRSIFDPSFEDLPSVIPVFPLAGALLLPGNKLPLNIFEPRYLAMIRAALTHPRLIGMIQPCSGRNGSCPNLFLSKEESLYSVGCAGRITSFSENDDGRYTITVQGVCRFRIMQELPPQEGYRLMKVDFSAYKSDLLPSNETIPPDQLNNFFDILGPYFEHHHIKTDWSVLKKVEIEKLVNSLSMLGNFEENEKQALLEAMTLQQRLEMLTCLMEIGRFSKNSSNSKN